MRNKYSEIEFISLACQKLMNKYHYEDLYLGVPCLNRCIDLIIDTSDGLIAVEFKMNNWKKAIEQTNDHLLGVDFAIICLPPKRSVFNIEQELLDTPLGLWIFDPESLDEWPFLEMVTPKKSQLKWSVAEQWVYQRIQGGGFHVGTEV